MEHPKLIIFLSGFILVTLFSVLFYVYFSGQGNDIEKIEEDIEKYAVFPMNLTCLDLKESISIEDALSATASIITLFKKLYIIYSNSFYALSRSGNKKREDEKSAVILHKGDYFYVYGILKEIPEKSYISIDFYQFNQKIIFLGGMRLGAFSTMFEDFLISEKKMIEKMKYYLAGSVNAMIDLSVGKMKIITRSGKFAVQGVGKEYGIHYSLISSFISQKDRKMEMEVKGEYIENNGVCYPFNLEGKFNITSDMFPFIFMRDLCYLSSDFSDFVLNNFIISSDGEVIKVRRKGIEKGVKEGESEGGEEIFYCYEIF